MENADIFKEGDAEMMSDATLHRLIEFLKTVKGFTDAEIVELLAFISSK